MNLIIVDRNGWEKPVKLEQAVLRIGSAPSSDIHLDSAQISPAHLQVHYLPQKIGGKILNLGGKVLLSRGETQEILSTYATTQVEDGDEILLGDYRIRFKLPLITKTIQKADSLKASLSFPNASINQYAATIGWLTIQNVGAESPCQFHVSLNGLPADCVQIDPVPLLYSGAEEEIRVQLFHRGLYPSAGVKNLAFSISAPSHYPREQVVIQQGVYVEPVFEQSLSLVDDSGTEASPKQDAVAVDEEKLPNSEVSGEIEQVEEIKESKEIEKIEEAKQPPLPAKNPVQVEEEKEEVSVAPPPAIPDKPPQVFEEPEEEMELEQTDLEMDEEEDEDFEIPAAKTPIKPVIIRSLPEDFWDEE